MNAIITKLRIYGQKPFRVAVIHGGPGAPGEMAPVARELSSVAGVLEPMQTAMSLEGQVRELHDTLEEKGEFPLTLIGWSWGAMLSFIFAARHPSSVAKLVLIGSGAYEEKYAAGIMPERLNRLSQGERQTLLSLTEALDAPATRDKNKLMARWGELMARADSYAPLPGGGDTLECQYDVYQSVWPQVRELRSSGGLLALGSNIRCPVVAIHGDYDPHPAEGVREPLSRTLKDFRFILLKNCGHCPWLEKEAGDSFDRILKSEIE